MSTLPIQIDELRSVDDRHRFESFPFRVYAEDPRWVPPLDLYQRARLSRRNPFFKEAELKRFVARRGDEVVGTISALRDPRHERSKSERTAFFGFYECLDDTQVAEALLNAAKTAARAWGATTLRGPRNLTRVEEVGVLVEGFDTPQPMLASHSRPYYQQQLEVLGGQKHHDVLAYEVEMYTDSGTKKVIPDYLLERARAFREGPDHGIHLRPASRLHLGRDLRLAHACFVEAFRDVPENTAMPRDQFVNLGRFFVFVSNRHMLQLATREGQAAGFALCFPDLNEALIAAGGHAFPLGWSKILAGLRDIRTSSFKLIGVLPEHRKSGLHAQMIVRAIEGSRDAGYRRMEASLVDERNGPMCKIVEGAGMSIYRRYRFYDFAL